VFHCLVWTGHVQGEGASDMPAHLLDDVCASRVRLPLQQINHTGDLTVRRKDLRWSLPACRHSRPASDTKIRRSQLLLLVCRLLPTHRQALSLPRPLSISVTEGPVDTIRWDSP
jgi:hypothetical protein